MLIDNIVYIIAIVIIGVFAIALNYYITNREVESSNKSERLTWLSEQTTRTLEAMRALKEAGCRPEIIERLNQHVTLQIEEISTLAPDSELMNEVNQKKEQTDNAMSSTSHLSNDRELKRIQIYITYTEKLVRQMVKANIINTKLGKSYMSELYWLNIRNVVDAHRTQADRVLVNNDKLAALSHLKHAKAILVRAQVSQSLKIDRLDDIQAKIDLHQPEKTPYPMDEDEEDDSMSNYY